MRSPGSAGCHSHCAAFREAARLRNNTSVTKNDLNAAANQRRRRRQRHLKMTRRISLSTRLAKREPSESTRVPVMQMCTLVRVEVFLAMVTIIIMFITCLSQPASLPVAYIGSIDVRRIDKPHDRRGDDLANDKSQSSASNAQVALFL